MKKQKSRLSKKGLAAIRKVQKLRWAKKKAVARELEHHELVMRDVATEEERRVTGKKSGALSSRQALFFHDVPPELYRRTARRHTVGHVKYTPGITMNLNWRQGLDDPHYVMDRLNQLFDHVVSFLDDGDGLDDNLAAIVWNVGFLMEVERLYPKVLLQVIGQSRLSGKKAEEFKKDLEVQQNANR